MSLTCEHACSTVFSTCPKLTGRNELSGYPDRSSPINPRPMAPEDLGAGIVSPDVVCPGVLESMPRTNKSRHGLPTLSPSGGPTPSASMLMAPSGTSSAPGSAWVGTPCRGAASLPSSVGVAGVSYTRDISASHTWGICISSASCTDSHSIGASWCATVGREELGGTKVRSLVLTANGATRDECRGITRCTANHWVIRVAEVWLLPHANHFLRSGK
jgi:hypothetical protein